jgi:hypothetical protein
LAPSGGRRRGAYGRRTQLRLRPGGRDYSRSSVESVDTADKLRWCWSSLIRGKLHGRPQTPLWLNYGPRRVSGERRTGDPEGVLRLRCGSAAESVLEALTAELVDGRGVALMSAWRPRSGRSAIEAKRQTALSPARLGAVNNGADRSGGWADARRLFARAHRSARKAVPDRDTLGGPPSISFWSKSPCQTRSRPVSVTLGPFCRIALKAQLLDDVIALFDGLRRREGNSWRT